MGLDIYMLKVKKTANEVESVKDVDLSNAVETAYFRKVNCLYGYFEDEMEDERLSFVDKYDVVDIINRAESIIQKAQEKPNDWQEFAEDTLPTRGGFFFGSTEYDEWYLEGLEQIIDQLSSVLANWDDDSIYVIEFSY